MGPQDLDFPTRRFSVDRNPSISFPRPARLPACFERLLIGGRRENRECELAYFSYKPFQFT